MSKYSILFVIISMMFSCSKDATVSREQEDFSTEIIGAWSYEDQMGDFPMYRTELIYTFLSDNTFIAERRILDSSTNQLVGFRYRSLGEYSLTNDELTLNSLQIFLNDNSALFSDLDDLVQTNNTSEEILNISFHNLNEELHFHYEPCGPMGNCIVLQIFKSKI